MGAAPRIQLREVEASLPPGETWEVSRKGLALWLSRVVHRVRAWRVESTGQRLDPSAEHPRRHLLAVQCRETRTGRKLLNGLTLPVCVPERGQEHERGETYYPLSPFIFEPYRY